jgi:hypothetical protein
LSMRSIISKNIYFRFIIFINLTWCTTCHWARSTSSLRSRAKSGSSGSKSCACICIFFLLEIVFLARPQILRKEHNTTNSVCSLMLNRWPLISHNISLVMEEAWGSRSILETFCWLLLLGLVTVIYIHVQQKT